MEFHFTELPGNTLGPVKQINVPDMRKDDSAPTGQPLTGVPVSVTDDYFLVGLSRGAEARNLQMMTDRNWIDMSVLLKSGKVAKVTFEKGQSGQRLLEGALKNWHSIAAKIGPAPLPFPAAGSGASFPEPRKVKTFTIRPDGSVLQSDLGEPGTNPEAPLLSPKQRPDKPKLDQLAKLLDQQADDKPVRKPIMRTKPVGNPPGQHILDPSDISGLLGMEGLSQKAAIEGETSPFKAPGSETGATPEMAALWDKLDRLIETQYQQCWAYPPGLSRSHNDPARYIPQIKVHYSEDGRLSGEPVLINQPSDPAMSSLAESALQAVRRCDPLKIPAQYAPYYDRWKGRVLRFDPFVAEETGRLQYHRTSERSDAIARQAVEYFLQKYRSLGMTGVNTSINSCYQGASTLSNISKIEYCYVIDSTASYVDSEISKSANFPPSSFNLPQKVVERVDRAFDDSGLDHLEFENETAGWSVLARNAFVNLINRSKSEAVQ